MDDFNTLRQQAETQRRESKTLDFKATLDINSTPEWVEVVKDIAAMANSGGGVLVIGVDNNGKPTGLGVASLLGCDPAKITDKIAKYTEVQFHAYQIEEIIRDGSKAAALFISGVDMPLVFVKEGGYDDENGKAKTAFHKGTIYFRHGAKSEPCNPSDLAAVIDRKVRWLRKEWLGNIRKVNQAPAGSRVTVLPPNAVLSSDPTAQPFRPTDDPNAPLVRVQDRDAMYPFRQKEVLEEVNKRLSGQLRVTSHDFLAVRKVLGIDHKKQFVSLAKFGSRQYTPAYAEWLVSEFHKDNNFFRKCVQDAKEIQQK